MRLTRSTDWRKLISRPFQHLLQPCKFWTRQVSGLSLVLSLGLTPAVLADNFSGDAVTMRNGDIHIGRIEQPFFVLSTDLGKLRISRQHIHTLVMQGKERDALITTGIGERISGSLEFTSLRVKRLQDPTLPLTFDDIARIDFGAKNARPASTDYPSRLETVSGDVLYLRLVPQLVTLENERGSNETHASSLLYIDSSLHSFDQELRTQFTLSDGRHEQGIMKPAELEFRSPHLDLLKVPSSQLSRLTLDLNLITEPAVEVFSDSLRTLGSGPQMIKIPGGRFLRGDYQGDGDDDEQPLAEVKLKPYAIGRYEITFDDYDVFCVQTGCDRPDDQEWGRQRRPVINVSWEEANAYTHWLAEKTGKPYRLPSDAEWEFAHRAGSITRYAWGDEVESARANCEGCGSIWDGDQTAPVGRFRANAFGLHDTAGNVFEWVADCFHDRFSEAPDDGAPVEKAGCGKRVIRGGAWSFPAHEVRSANRWRDFPSRRSDDTGFRVAMDLE